MSPCWSYLFIGIKMGIAALVLLYFYLVVAPYFFVQTTTGHRITVDLTHPMDAKVMRWIADKPFDIKIRNGSRSFGNRTIWYQTDEISFSSHTGTHLDAPVHFWKTGNSVSDIPLDRLIEKPLCIVDITEQSQTRRDYAATIDDIREFEEINGEIPEDSVVVFRTGWARHWPNSGAYYGTEGSDPEQVHFPGISASAARFLAHERRVVGVGIDGPSIDCGQCGAKWAFPAHVQLAQSNVYALENLDVSLFRLPNVGATITVLPLKIVAASGSPARIIAQYSLQHHDTNSGSSVAPLVYTLLPLTLTSMLKL